MQQPQSRRSNNPSTMKIKDPTPKLFRKTNLVILEAASTTYALVLTLITENFSENVVCKFLFQPHSSAILVLYFYTFHLFRTHIFQIFFFPPLWGGHTHIQQEHQVKLTEMQHLKISIQFKSRAITATTST